MYFHQQETNIMIRQFISILFIFGFYFLDFSQTTFGVSPVLSGKVTKTSTFHTMELVDSEKEIQANELQNAGKKEKIMQYGKELPVDFSIATQSEKTTLPNGDVVYQFGIYCKDAVSINLVFDQYQLKMGSTLYVVGCTKNEYVGAYTSLNNSESHVLGTELVNDTRIIIELVEPKENVGTSKLHLGSVIHGFRSLETLVKRSLNSSGICNIDVNCPQGKGYESQRNSVAIMINSAGGFCTGTLLNTTAGPFKPYLLSAYHCGTNPAAWVFRFRWESPEENVDCGTSKPSVDGPKDMSVNGATLVAGYKATDFILCELNAAPSSLWNVFYAGWDKSGKTPLSGTGIHHPIADIKKISLDYDTLTSEAFNKGEPLNHWRSNWDQGITESGSSGSPIFDQSHRVVGQLHGGDSDCISKFMTDYYAKLSESWKGGGTPETRLKDWLDPIDVNVDFIDGSTLLKNDPLITYNASNLRGRFCDDTLHPYVILSNGGSDTLRSLTLNYYYDTDSLTQIAWNGALGLYDVDTVFLPKQKFTKGSHIFTVNLMMDSGFVDGELTNNSFSSSFTILGGTKKYTLELQLDTNGEETVWYMTDSTNKIWYKGGPYVRTITKPTIIRESFCLQANCYTFSVYDYAGDGLYVNDSIIGNYRLLDEDKTIVMQLLPSEAKFATSATKSFCFTSQVETIDFENQLSIFPNPSNLEVIHIASKSQEIDRVELITITGQVIGTYTFNAKEISIPLQNVANGMYYLRIRGGAFETTKPFVRF